jgi:tetratricopeptide (TPR) repeat protein
MTDNGKEPTLWGALKWILDHYGVSGLIIAVLLCAIYYVYTHWDKVSKWPGIDSIVAYFKRWPIPKADPRRFSVVVARLEKDVNNEYQRLIVEALKEFEGIQVLAIDTTISVEGPVPEDEEEQGHESARSYLKKTGGSVLIWGTALNLGGKTVPKLYWTASYEWDLKPRRYDAPLVEAQFQLPTVFWSDLWEVLRLFVASHYDELIPEHGLYVADRLPSFIARVRTLLQATEGSTDWGADARAATHVILADALQVYGDQSGKSEPILEAVAGYREALKEWTRDRAPVDWAITQNNLGNALCNIGERESGTQLLEESVAAYREALKERPRDRVPLRWAMTQNNLGGALLRLGERESGTEHLEESVAACREALKEFTADRVPLDRAMTLDNLGGALFRLGERESSTERLEEAVAAHREALKEWPRDRVPLRWAVAQSNLGAALCSLGDREGCTERLEEAVATFRAALEERTRDRVPFDWAATQNNLGCALRNLGKREGGTERLEEAVSVYREALKEWGRDRAPLQWAMTQNNLGNALRNLGEREGGVLRLGEAVAAYRAALGERTRDRVPIDCAATQYNLGGALLLLGERECSTQRLDEAVTTFKAALEIFESGQASYYVQETKAYLRRTQDLLQAFGHTH